MRFENIWAFYFLIIIPIIWIGYWWHSNWQKKQLRELGTITLVEKMVRNKAKNKPLLKMVLRTLSFTFLIVAMANPQMGTKIETVKRMGADIVVAIDVSKSMLAQDATPNRIGKSKMIVSKLLEKLKGDRIGLIVYAGQAYCQVPLTTDYSAVKMFLSTIHTDMVPSQGTAIAEAISMSQTGFSNQEMKNNCLIIISDGENHEEIPDEILEKSKNLGVQIHTVGIGTTNGGPIPMKNGEFKKDKNAQVVITKLQPQTLNNLASKGNGTYQEGNSISLVVEKLEKIIGQLDKAEMEQQRITDYEDQFFYFALIGLFILMIEFMLSNQRSMWWEELNIFANN